jgi:hypothetical protein
VANWQVQERSERVLGRLKSRSSIDVHWKHEFHAFEEETHGHLSQHKPLNHSLFIIDLIFPYAKHFERQ